MFRTIYCRCSNFIRELTISVVEGSYPKLAAKFAKRDLLIINYAHFDYPEPRLIAEGTSLCGFRGFAK
jgi:hypothetical protein